MSIRPPVVRKYGRSTRPTPSSSSSSGPSLIFESSPPSSPILTTPHASSDLALDLTFETDLAHGPSSPIKPSSTYSGGGKGKKKQKENVPITTTTVHLAGDKRPVQSTLGSFFATPTPGSSLAGGGPSRTKKRPLNVGTAPTPINPIATSKPLVKREGMKLTQMHLTHLPLLHTCQQCQMSYVRGGEDDGVHERHHASVIRGIVWGDGLASGSRRKSGSGDQGYRVVRDHVEFGTKGRGKVVLVEGSYGGSKLDEILRTVDTVLSSPPLPPAILTQCKVFLFVTASPAPTKRLRPGFQNERIPKERIVAVVVAQPIKWAMRVLRPDDSVPGADVGVVDSGEGVLCDPTRLDTPLGIHRLFTIPSYRALGLSRVLLDAACQYTVYGCQFDPLRGDVAFSQPTNSGKGVMDHWGQGQVRVFVDDESQL